MTKIKADPDGPEAQAEACSGERTYQELLVNQNPIAQPLASRRLTRKLYKCIKKGEADPGVAGMGARVAERGPDRLFCRCSGEAEADSARGERGSEICQQRRKRDLGAAAGSKRPTCVIMVKPHDEYQEAYDECLEEVQSLPLPL
uniref:NHP2 ribonucleoprotein n=1 Tax=Pongo abelii TaxID=9601 RepID=A0A8I5T5M2_PONAB